MKRIIGLCVVLAALAGSSSTAGAHTGWCGHTYKEFYEDTPQGLTKFREVFGWGYTSGGHHYHVVQVYRYAPYREPGDRWVFVHEHANRQCAAHPV